MRRFKQLIGWSRKKAQEPPPVLSFSDSKLDLSDDTLTPITFSHSARLLDEPIAASSTPSTENEQDSLWNTLPDGVVAAASPLLDGFLAKLGNYTCIGYIKNYQHVVVARDNTKNTYVIIKTQQARSPRREEAEYKSIHEAGIMQMISDVRLSALRGHCNILSFIDHTLCFSTNLHLAILEYCEGGSLYRFTKYHGHRASVDQKLTLLRDSANGLCYLHDMNIAHRDIKIDNMFLKYDDTQQRFVVKIGDFGFATMSLEDSMFTEKRGSAAFAAPELLEQGQYNPFPTDVWAFGVVIYALLECKFPFEIHTRDGKVRHGALDIIFSRLGEMAFTNVDVNVRLGPLINTIFQYNPDLRPTMGMIASSSFFPTRPTPITRDMLRSFEVERAALRIKKTDTNK